MTVVTLPANNPVGLRGPTGPQGAAGTPGANGPVGPPGGSLASATEVEITGTAAQAILVYTPALALQVLVGGYLRVVAAATITVTVQYTDAGGTVQTVTLLNGVAEPIGPVALDTIGLSVNPAAITVTVTSSVANAVYASAFIDCGSGVPLAGQIVCEFSGGGVPPSTGVEQDVVLPFTGTLTEWQIAADQVGSATIDVWMAAWASYPPTSANDITGGNPPALASAASAESTSLTGWTTAITAGDVMRFQLAAVATVTRVLLVLTYTRL